MTWTLERKREACMRAPMSATFLRPDTRIVERRGWCQVLTPSSATMANEVVLSQVSEDEADRVIEQTISTYAEHGLRTQWRVGPWTLPTNFGDRLKRRGFREWGVRGMGRSTLLAIQAKRFVGVEEVTSGNLDEYLETVAEGWNLPRGSLEAERCVCISALEESPRHGYLYLARMGDKAVGTAALIVRGDYGYLLGAQVLEASRGRGAYRALVAARLSSLRRANIEYAVTHAREDTSVPMLAHLGFETLFHSKCYVLDASEESPPVAWSS